MALSVSAFPEPSPGDSKLITRLFGANRTMDEPQPRQQTRPLPSSASSSSQPNRATSYKRSRTSSQGFGSGSTTPTTTTSTPIPISWASRPVDLNAQRPVGAGYRSPPRVNPSLPRRHITSISTTCVSTPISSSSSTPTSAFTCGGPTSFIDTPANSFNNSPCLPRARSHSISRLGIRRERSLDGFQTRMRMSPPLPSSPVPLGLSFARLASVSPPQNRTNRVQSQSAVKIGGGRDRGDTGITTGTSAATGNNNNNTTTTTTRPTFRSLPYKSPTITSPSINPDFEPVKTINTTSPIIPPSMTTAPTTTADVITRPTPSGPRTIGGKPKLQLSLQIPSIPLLGQQEQEEEQGEQNRNKKPQLPALKLITDTIILHPASTTSSSPSIKLSPSPSSPSPISYVSYSHPHSPVSPAATNAKQLSSSSPPQLSPTHSLFSADSRIHLHPLSLSSPISGTASGSGSVRTSVRGWVIGSSTTGSGGGVSPGGRSVKSLGGRSVNSLGGRRPRSVRSTRSMRSNRSRRSTTNNNNKIKIHNNNNNNNIPPVSTPDSISTPTPIYSTNTFAYTHLGISGDHVGEFVGDGDGEEKDGFVYGGYGYIEDGWGGGRSPSPIRYARSDSRGILISSDTEDDGGGGGGVYRGGVYGGRNGTGDDSAASSEVEFADVDGDSDSDDDRIRRRRRSRKWKGSRDRRRDPPTTTTTTTTNPSSPSLPLHLPQFVLVPSHLSSHPSPHSNPSASSPLSSSSSTNSYSNPYSTRKDRKKARKIQLRSFRNSYRMPPVVPLEQQERGRGRGEEKKGGGGKSNRTSSPTVMKSMIPFRRKTPPPVTGEEQDSANASAKKKKKEGKNKSKDKDKEKGTRTTTTTKRKPTKSAIDLFNSVSASMSASASQSASTSVLSSNFPQSVSSSSSVPPLPGTRIVLPPSHSFHPQNNTHSQSGSGSTFNTRTSSPDLSGRKPTNNTTRKKFAEAVSSALEEVTSRGRAAGGAAPFQPASKTKALTAYSSSSQSIPFDEMEVLDISRLPGGDDDDSEGSVVDGKMGAVMAYSGTVPFDEMEVLDISLPHGGGAEAEAEQQQQQQTEEGKKKQETRPLAMMMGIKSDDGVRTTSSSLPESDRFPSGYSGTKVTASTTVTSPVPLPSSSSNPNSQHQQQKQQLRGSSLEGATTNRVRNSSGSNRRQYSGPQQPYNRNSPFQLQPAYTTGISCGLPVSRPQPFGNPRRSAVRSRSPPPSLRLLPTPPFSAPLLLPSSSSSGSVVGLEVAVSPPSPFITTTTATTATASSRSAGRLFVSTTPPFSVPVITVSDSGDKGPAGHVEMEGTN